jgi:cystathionine beta-synthase
MTMILYGCHSFLIRIRFGFTDAETNAKRRHEVEQWGGATIRQLNLPPAVCVDGKTTCQEALDISKQIIV